MKFFTSRGRTPASCLSQYARNSAFVATRDSASRCLPKGLPQLCHDLGGVSWCPANRRRWSRSPTLPALYAATSPDARGRLLYGPKGPGHMGGAATEQTLYSRLRNEADARRIWKVSEELTGVRFPTE